MLKSYFLYSVFSFSIFFFSCKEKKTLKIEKTVRNTLQINFNENILKLNPHNINSRSEKFVVFLLYEGLYMVNKNEKIVPALIEQCFLDSLSLTYFFKIKRNITFQNGNILNSHHIYTCFKRIFDADEKNISSVEKSFRDIIKGYKKYFFHKTYKSENDSLPEGFKIIDKYSFSIQFIKPIPNLFLILSNPDFWIYKKEKNNIYTGTGLYNLDYANEDIFYRLVKNKNYHLKNDGKLDTINIYFIKDKDIEINEFLNESLDLLIYNPNKFYPYNLNKVLNVKYGKYNKYESSISYVKHLSLHNINSLNLKRLMFHLLQFKEEINIVNFNNYNNQTEFEKINPSIDSINYYAQKIYFIDSMPKIKIPILNNCMGMYKSEFEVLKENLSLYFDLYQINISKINPIAPYLVIEESEIPIYTKDPDNKTLLKILNKTKKYTSFSQSVLIINYKREEVYTNVMLKGLKPYTDWTKELNNLYFIKPKIY